MLLMYYNIYLGGEISERHSWKSRKKAGKSDAIDGNGLLKRLFF
jgi:hypothetical protein